MRACLEGFVQEWTTVMTSVLLQKEHTQRQLQMYALWYSCHILV